MKSPFMFTNICMYWFYADIRLKFVFFSIYAKQTVDKLKCSLTKQTINYSHTWHV